MKNLLGYIAAVSVVAAALLASGCGSSEHFTVECDIEGLGTEQVEMIYFSDALEKVTAHGEDGHVEFIGSSAEPAIVQVFAIDGRELFTAVASNGDKIKVKMSLDSPLEAEIKGNEASAEISAFVRENASLLGAAGRDSINALIARHIIAKPDRMASTAILMTMYDFSDGGEKGDSLLALLTPQARGLTMTRNFAMLLADKAAVASTKIVRPISVFTGRDTLINFLPYRASYHLLAILSGEKTDTLRSLMRTLRRDYKDKRLGIFEISVEPDSARWRAQIEPDSAKWDQGWLMGGTANPAIRNLYVNRLPLFIVVDSVGRQLYRGPSADKAATLLRSTL